MCVIKICYKNGWPSSLAMPVRWMMRLRNIYTTHRDQHNTNIIQQLISDWITGIASFQLTNIIAFVIISQSDDIHLYIHDNDYKHFIWRRSNLRSLNLVYYSFLKYLPPPRYIFYKKVITVLRVYFSAEWERIIRERLNTFYR